MRNGEDRPRFPTGEPESREEDTESMNSAALRPFMEANRSNSSLSLFEVYPGAERSEFNFSNERLGENTTNLFQSIAYMVKGCLGIGILCIHEAYMWAGIYASLILTVVLGTLAIHSTLILVRIAQTLYSHLRIAKLSYPDLVQVVMGTGPRWARCISRCFRICLELVTFVQMCSCCNIYQIMMATTFRRAIEENFKWNFAYYIYMIMITIPIVLLCLIRRFKYLALFAISADIIIVVCVIFALSSATANLPDLSNRTKWASVQGCFRFCGVLLYSIDGTTLALPIENHMRYPKYFSTVVWFAIPTVLVFVSVVGFMGYWIYGEKCESPINLHTRLDTTFTMVLQFLFISTLSLSYAINFWVPFKTAWHYIGRGIKKHQILWELIMKLILIVFLSIFSILCNNLMKFTSLIGNVCLSILTIIVPALLDVMVVFRPKSSSIYLTRREWGEYCQVIRDTIYIIIGLILMSGGLYSFFYPDRPYTV